MIFTYGREEDGTILGPDDVNEAYREDQTADIALFDVPDDVVDYIQSETRDYMALDVGVNEDGMNALLAMVRQSRQHGLEVEVLKSYTEAIQRGSTVSASVLSACADWDVL